MHKELLGSCPVCGGRMHVRELGCHDCDINIRGEFELSPFNALSKEELRFVEIFLRNQGNLREVQAELGLSYPTVKKALENVIRSLGYDVKPEAPAQPPASDPDGQDILGRLKNREITVDEAVERLKSGRKPV